MRIMMASLVDPAEQLGGAWTMTRGLLALLRGAPLGADVEVVSSPRRSRAGHQVRQATALVHSFATGLPAKIAFHREPAVLTAVMRLTATRPFDLALLNGANMLWLLPHLPRSLPTVLVAHNIEHQLFTAYLRWRLKPNGLAARLLRKDRERLQLYEGGGLVRAHHVIFLSAADADYAAAEWPGLHAMTLPPIFDATPAPHQAPRGSTLEVGMVANFEWWANREGLAWFVRDVLPHLSPGIRLHLFGQGSLDATRPDSRIICHGPVDRVEEAWARCDVAICPVLSASGVSIKLAEAVYHRVPVLATSLAVRGLPLAPHPSIVLRDDAAGWTRCLNDEGLTLARQVVPGEFADTFRVDAHAQAVSVFLLDAVAPQTKIRKEA